MKKNKFVLTSLTLLSSVFLANTVLADEPASKIDLSSLTQSIDFSGVLTGVMGIGGTLITLYAGVAGVKWILRMVKGA